MTLGNRRPGGLFSGGEPPGLCPSARSVHSARLAMTGVRPRTWPFQTFRRRCPSPRMRLCRHLSGRPVASGIRLRVVMPRRSRGGLSGGEVAAEILERARGFFDEAIRLATRAERIRAGLDRLDAHAVDRVHVAFDERLAGRAFDQAHRHDLSAVLLRRANGGHDFAFSAAWATTSRSVKPSSRTKRSPGRLKTRTVGASRTPSLTAKGRAWRSLLTSTVRNDAPPARAPAAASFAAISSRRASGVTKATTATGRALRARTSAGGRPAFSLIFGRAGFGVADGFAGRAVRAGVLRAASRGSGAIESAVAADAPAPRESMKRLSAAPAAASRTMGRMTLSRS